MKRLILVALIILALLSTAAKDVLEARVDALEVRLTQLEQLFESQLADAPLSGDFIGTGNTQTRPFTVGHSPWLLEWEALVTRKASTSLGIHVISLETGYAGGYGFRVSQGKTNGQTWMYIPTGTYYLQIDTGGYVQWAVEIN